MQLPPAATTEAQAGISAPSGSLPDDPSVLSSIPEAHVVPMPQPGTPVQIKANKQTYRRTDEGNIYTLEGDAVIYYRDYIVHADRATYNDETGEIVAEGHLMVDGGPDDEHFEASHGTVNVQQQTGHF